MRNFIYHTYQTRDELHRTHPENTSYQMVLTVGPGATAETIVSDLRKWAERHPGCKPHFYRVGNFVWTPKPASEPIPSYTTTPQCSCAEYPGDDPDCRTHGALYAQYRALDQRARG